MSPSSVTRQDDPRDARTIDHAIVAELAPTGTLRAAINLGNQILAHGSTGVPAGVTVDPARQLAAGLGLESSLVSCDAARSSFMTLRSGAADIGFLARDPERETALRFSDPYVTIDGVFAVPTASPLTEAGDVDRPGVRVALNQGSAYDLFLSRTLRHAEIIHAGDGIAAFDAQRLEAVAGIRQSLTRHLANRPGVRLLEPPFMQIHQCLAIRRDRTDAALRFLNDTVAALIRSGFVDAALTRAGQDPTLAASPSTRRRTPNHRKDKNDQSHVAPQQRHLR